MRDYATPARTWTGPCPSSRPGAGRYVQHVLGHRARVRLDQGDWPGREDARAALAERVQGGPEWSTPCAAGPAASPARRPAPRATLQEATAGPSPPASCSGWRGGRGPGRARLLQGDDRRAPRGGPRLPEAVPPSTPGSPGAGPWRRLAATRRRCRRWWPSRTGCCWPATGRPPRRLGSDGLPLPPGTRPGCGDPDQPCWRHWPCWTAWGRGRRPSGSGASCGGAAPLRVPRAQPGTAVNPPPHRPPARGARAAGRGPTDAEIAPTVAVGQDGRPPRLGLLAKLGVTSRRQAAAGRRQLGAIPARDGEPDGQS